MSVKNYAGIIPAKVGAGPPLGIFEQPVEYKLSHAVKYTEKRKQALPKTVRYLKYYTPILAQYQSSHWRVSLCLRAPCVRIDVASDEI